MSSPRRSFASPPHSVRRCDSHGVIKHLCRPCGGASICKEHGKRRTLCRECNGGSRCPCGTIRRDCKNCKPYIYRASKFRSKLLRELRAKRLSSASCEVLGVESYDAFMDILRAKPTYEDWMTPDRMGTYRIGEEVQRWNLDHILPVSSAKSFAELDVLLKHTNIQPLSAYHNLVKSNCGVIHSA